MAMFIVPLIQDKPLTGKTITWTKGALQIYSLQIY